MGMRELQYIVKGGWRATMALSCLASAQQDFYWQKSAPTYHGPHVEANFGSQSKLPCSPRAHPSALAALAALLGNCCQASGILLALLLRSHYFPNPLWKATLRSIHCPGQTSSQTAKQPTYFGQGGREINGGFRLHPHHLSAAQPHHPSRMPHRTPI